MTMNMNMHLNNLKEQAKTGLVYLKDPWTLSWVVSGLLAILIPVITWSSQRGAYYNAVGAALESEQYYENQNNNNDNNNNNQGDDYYSVYKECSWFNWPCRKKQYYYATMDEGGDGNDDGEYRQEIPSWYLFLGGLENSEEMQRWKEENTGIRQEEGNVGTSGGIKFVYALNLILFVALLSFGAKTIGNKQPVCSLRVFLILTAIISFMNLIMAAQGLISSDERDYEGSYYGWYGQMGVLMTYTNFWMMLFSIGFLIAFRVRTHLEEAGEKEDMNEQEMAEYQKYDDKEQTQEMVQDYSAPEVDGKEKETEKVNSAVV